MHILQILRFIALFAGLYIIYKGFINDDIILAIIGIAMIIVDLTLYLTNGYIK